MESSQPFGRSRGWMSAVLGIRSGVRCFGSMPLVVGSRTKIGQGLFRLIDAPSALFFPVVLIHRGFRVENGIGFSAAHGPGCGGMSEWYMCALGFNASWDRLPTLCVYRHVCVTGKVSLKTHPGCATSPPGPIARLNCGPPITVSVLVLAISPKALGGLPC